MIRVRLDATGNVLYVLLFKAMAAATKPALKSMMIVG